MSAPQIEFAYPVAWPIGRKKEGGRKQAQWKSGGSRLTFDQAVRRLAQEVGAITKPGQSWRARELTLSTNFELRVDDRPRRDRSRPVDQAVAFYLELDGQPLLLACDRFDRIEDNIAAIAAHIDALRGQERWGVADLKQAFAGHVALPAPEQWWQVLGVSEQASVDQIDAAWREKMRAAHPDRAGGRPARCARCQQATCHHTDAEYRGVAITGDSRP